MADLYAGPIELGEQVIQPLRELARPLADLTGPMPYTVIQSSLDALFPAGVLNHYWKSHHLTSLNNAVIALLVERAINRPSKMTIIDL